MNIDYLLDRIKSERECYYRSLDKGEKGRFYILDKLYESILKLEEGFDEKHIRELLATLARVHITNEEKIESIAKEIYTTTKPVFKVPVFPIKYDLENIEKDLLSVIFKELEEGINHWLLSIPSDEIKTDENLKRWQREMINQSKNASNKSSNFTRDPVSFLRRSASLGTQGSLESQIQDYISGSNLPPEAKLPAFHFITRCGGNEMSDMLNSVLEKQFGDLSKFDSELSHEINWTYNRDKLPTCNASLNIDLQNMLNEQDNEEKPAHNVNHDPRLITMDDLGPPTEPDMQIKSKTSLVWLSETIIPYINSITISGQYAHLLPLIMESKNKANNKEEAEEIKKELQAKKDEQSK